MKRLKRPLRRRSAWHPSGPPALGGLAVALIAAVASLLALAPVPAAAAGGCPNEAIREAQGATGLPECRAYELVSAPGNVPNFGEVRNGVIALELERAAATEVNGVDRMSYQSLYAPETAQEANGQYLAQRGAGGWKTTNVIPLQSPGTQIGAGCLPFMYFSDDLTAGVLADGVWQTGFKGKLTYCGHDEPSLVGGEPQEFFDEGQLEYQNLLVTGILPAEEGSYRLVNRTPRTADPTDAVLQATSTDFSHVVFSEAAQLTPEAPIGSDVYEWVDGTVHLVSVLPDGTPTAGTVAGGAALQGGTVIGASAYEHAVSSDGSSVVFNTGNDLYLRVHADREPSAMVAGSPAVNGEQCLDAAKACTIQLDASTAGGGGGGVFLVASEDGERIFFMDSAAAELTTDTQSGSGENLYEYEVATKTLVDLTAQADADVLGVSGYGEEADGPFHLYFVAEAKLAEGGTAGEPNLYALTGTGATGGQPEFVATLATGGGLEGRGNQHDWEGFLVGQPGRLEANGHLTTRVSPDGEFVAFNSANPETAADLRESRPGAPFPSGYDSVEAGGEAAEEIYLYDATTQELSCVSCDPTGQRPSAGGTGLREPMASSAEDGPGYLQRVVLDDGHVFFQTPEGLVAQDTNGVSDVYEYSAGTPHLISTGSSPQPSIFAEADESGQDVFFATGQGLVGADTDNALSLYDAREDGGFPEPQPLGGCQGEECRQLPSPPALAPAGSTTFAGPGNHGHGAGPGKAANRRRRLHRSLKKCRRVKPGAARAHCRQRARRRYGVKTTHGSRSRRHKGGAR
jgi:hypothetical protein